MGQWRYSLQTDKPTATMQLAKRVFSLAEEQNNPALIVGACHISAATLFYLGDFQAAREYAIRGVQIWRSGAVLSPVEDVETGTVPCLCYEAILDWHFGEIATAQAKIAEAIALAKKLNDMHGLAVALCYAAFLGHHERNPAEVERVASELIELSTIQNFAHWLLIGSIFRGWARSASGATKEGIPWIEQGIRDYRATGIVLALPYHLARRAEALHLAGRTSEALETIDEAEALGERFENRYWWAELHRLRAVFLAAVGGDETQIEASLFEAIRIAKEQKSVSLEKRAEGTYAEYSLQKARALGAQGFRLPI
jgi:predicted ATPase